MRPRKDAPLTMLISTRNQHVVEFHSSLYMRPLLSKVQEIMARLGDEAPGLDGVLYRAWQAGEAFHLFTPESDGEGPLGTVTAEGTRPLALMDPGIKTTRAVSMQFGQ